MRHDVQHHVLGDHVVAQSTVEHVEHALGHGHAHILREPSVSHLGRADAKREAEAAVTEARAKYDADLFALFSEFGRIPSREALITNDTPVGHVVRLPESAIVPAKAATA